MSWIDALRLPRMASASQDHVFVTLDEVRQLTTIPINEDDLATRRDQAAVAMLFLSGMRAGAFGTLPIECVDLSSRTIKQWLSLGVKTKNSKTATTYLLNIPELLSVVARWDTFLREQLPITAPWYTPIITQ